MSQGPMFLVTWPYLQTSALICLSQRFPWQIVYSHYRELSREQQIAKAHQSQNYQYININSKQHFMTTNI